MLHINYQKRRAAKIFSSFVKVNKYPIHGVRTMDTFWNK